MSELSRKADQYWRSRTINEAQLLGYTGLRLTCGCGRITDYPFTHSCCSDGALLVTTSSATFDFDVRTAVAKT
jgi:hypothetical protein